MGFKFRRRRGGEVFVCEDRITSEKKKNRERETEQGKPKKKIERERETHKPHTHCG